MEEYLKSLVSPNTRKSYRYGLEKFIDWYGKPLKSLLEEQDVSKIIERYYVELKQEHPQNTCRVRVNPIIQWLKYNNVDLKLRKGLHIYKTEVTTRDHILTISQVRDMWKIADLEDKVLLKTWMLGLRISDASRLKWSDFENTSEVLVNTRKEGIVAHCFIDEEFQELLKKYIPTLDKDNPFLFQSARGKRLSNKQIVRRVKKLAKKVGLNNNKRFGWHIARKLFLRKATELGVNMWSAKMMVGKAVDKSIATYIQGVSLEKDAKKLSEVLRLNPTESSEKTEDLKQAIISLEKENKNLRTRIQVLQEELNRLSKTVNIDMEKRLVWLENKLDKKEKIIFEG